ncbi:WD40 repeat domain-containing protein [Saccharospirillum alexandrii]|uniref:WD40 repeat domain-containing protein n=1 Tax=Saccharospirillum alexandrii TaxID=2448477 RepID=UPI0016C97442
MAESALRTQGWHRPLRPLSSASLRRLTITALLALALGGCFPQNPDDQFELATRGAYHGTLTPNANGAVVGSIHHGGSFWSLHPPARQFNWNHDPNRYTEVLYTDVSADGQRALTADYNNLALWNTRTGEPVWYWTAPARIQAVDLSADGSLALLGLSNNQAVLFDAINGGVLRNFDHEGPVISVSLSDDARIALTGSEDLTARLWSVTDNRRLQTFTLPNQVKLVKLTGDARLALLAPADETAQLWNLVTGEQITELATGDVRVYSARFESAGRLLIGTTQRRILQFNVETGERTGLWQIGSFWSSTYQSATVLDMRWRNERLWALGSDGYLYAF